MIVDIGVEDTSITPVYDHVPLFNSHEWIAIGGDSIGEELYWRTFRHDLGMSSPLDRSSNRISDLETPKLYCELARKARDEIEDIKVKVCAFGSVAAIDYTLLNSAVIKISPDARNAGSCLFQRPRGLQDAVLDCLLSCPIDIRFRLI